MTRIDRTFGALRSEGRKGFVAYIMAGDPDEGRALEVMKGLPGAGVDIIELGLPFTDPMADGPTIQLAGGRALEGGMTLQKTLAMVAAFRETDDATPIVLMGYYNPIYARGVDAFLAEARAAGVDGLIIVDLPPEEDAELCIPAQEAGLNFIRLATPTTDDARRLPKVLQNTSGFCVLRLDDGDHGGGGCAGRCGGPGGRAHQIQHRSAHRGGLWRQDARGVGRGGGRGRWRGRGIGHRRAHRARRQPGGCAGLREITGRCGPSGGVRPMDDLVNSFMTGPDENGRFGKFGGRFVSETLMPLILELEAQYERAKTDDSFWSEMNDLWAHYVGRPSPLYFAERLTDRLGGAKIYLKRDELNHTGAHKINNVLGQIILARRMGKSRIIAETGAGQHGVATATVCAKFGLKCVVYMGRARRRTSGAQCVPHASAGRRGRAGDLGSRHAEGRDERCAARLGDQCARHVLLHRHGGGSAPVSGDGARFPVDHRQGGPHPAAQMQEGARAGCPIR